MMTPNRLKEILSALSLSDGQLIRWLSVDDRVFRRWKLGDRIVPDDAEQWLEGLAKYFEDHPPPQLKGRARNSP